ncbi:hypothetical protein [Streptomyces sp. 5-10]|uniref:hypothetical protein n=1 Tax=Streptomyces sp. 5-10 TaxID=878925 RepID=UPI00168A46BB|nr:hypothetical protein [Streptomyces sp. 5-10]MBD3004843.1 hypothetical protein [Streptomyces sp. 5-10]
MAAVILVAVQSIALLGAVALGAWLAIKLGLAKRALPRAPSSNPPSITAFLPSASSAELHDLQQGLACLGHVLARLETGTARPQEYEEAKALAQWTLDAGKAAEDRLARRIGIGEYGDGRMNAETAKDVVARCRVEGIPQRTIARITGWSKSWVADQCLLAQDAKSPEPLTG